MAKDLDSRRIDGMPFGIDDPIRALLVEDEPPIQRTYKRLAEMVGLELLPLVDNYDDALRVAAEHRPHIALIDLMLPGEMLGCDIARYLLNQGAIGCVVMSSSQSEAAIAEARRVGRLAVMPKPLNVEQFRNVVANALTDFQVLTDSGSGTGDENSGKATWVKAWRLSEMEALVAVCLMKGLSDREVAEKLGLTHKQAHNAAKRVRTKAGVRRRSALQEAAKKSTC